MQSRSSYPEVFNKLQKLRELHVAARNVLGTKSSCCSRAIAYLCCARLQAPSSASASAIRSIMSTQRLAFTCARSTSMPRMFCSYSRR